MARFIKAMAALAAKTNCLFTFDEASGTAYLIECGPNGRPARNVWRKAFTFDGVNVTVKVHGKTLRTFPLAQIA